MANWPDAGRYALTSTGNQCNAGATETQLAEYAFYIKSNAASFHGGGLFTQLKAPTSVVIQIPNTTPGNNIAILNRGILVDQVWAGTSTFFYDLNDGLYTAVDCTTGQSWTITVVGTSVTIIPASGSSGIRPTLGQIFPLGLVLTGGRVSNINSQFIFTSGTFSIPSGVSQLKYKIVGPGGGGGGSVSTSTSGGGGGGGGGLGEGIISVGVNTSLAVVIGVPGLAGGISGSASNGTDGTSSSITGSSISIIANGGKGGLFVNSGSAVAGGAGGTVTGAAFASTGGQGGQGVTYGTGDAQAGAAGGAASGYTSVLGGTYGMGGGGGANGIKGQDGVGGYVMFEWVA